MSHSSSTIARRSDASSGGALSHRASASSDLTSLIADTERLMQGLTTSIHQHHSTGGGGGGNTYSTAATTKQQQQQQQTTTTVTRTLESHHLTTAATSSASASASHHAPRSLSPRPSHLPRASSPRLLAAAAFSASSKIRSPSPIRLPSSSAASSSSTTLRTSATSSVSPRLHTRPALSTSPSVSPRLRPTTLHTSTYHAVQHRPRSRSVSPSISPRLQAQREMSRYGLKTSSTFSSHLTSPVRSEGVTYPTGASSSSLASDSHRATSASPTRTSTTTNSASNTSRTITSNLDTTLRFENLQTPAPSAKKPASRSASPRPSSASSSSHLRPTPLDTSALRAAATIDARNASSSNNPIPHSPWRELNRQLALNGYEMVQPFPADQQQQQPLTPNSQRYYNKSGLSNQPPSVALSNLLKSFTALLSDYGRRGDTIQELMNHSHAETNQHVHCYNELTNLRKINQQQKSQIDELHRKLMEAEYSATSNKHHDQDQLAAMRQKYEISSTQFYELERNTQYKIKEMQQSHADEMARFQAKYDDMLRKYEARLQEYDIRYQQAQHGHDASLHEKDLALALATNKLRDTEIKLQEATLQVIESQSDKRELVDMKEREKYHTQTKYSQEIKEMNAAIQNEQIKSQTLQARLADMEEKLHVTQRQYEHERTQSRMKFNEQEEYYLRNIKSLEDQLHASVRDAQEVDHMNLQLRADNATLKARLQSQDDTLLAISSEHRAAQELIRDLEHKVAQLQKLAIDAHNKHALESYLTRDGRMELLSSRSHVISSMFDVQRIREMPQHILVELVLQVCLKLKVNDVTLIPQTLEQLISVASAVPGMQQFLGDVWKIVTNGNAGVNGSNTNLEDLNSENLLSLLRTILPTLKQWSRSHTYFSSLDRFHYDILDAARKRVHRSPLNPLHSAQNASSAHTSTEKLTDTLPLEELAMEIHDIVANENRLNALVYDQHASPSSFFALWALMDKTPLVTSSEISSDPEKIISHIQQLFDIPHRVGLFPKMNELFLFVNETRPAIQAMRALLKLDSRATIHTCIKALKRLVDSGSERSGANRHNDSGVNESMNGSGGKSKSQSNGMTSPTIVRNEGIRRGGLAWTVTSPSKHESSFVADDSHGQGASSSSSLHNPQATTSSSFSSSAAKDQSHNNQIQRSAKYYEICKQLKVSLGVKKMSEILGAVRHLALSSSQQQPKPQQSSKADPRLELVMNELLRLFEITDISELPRYVRWTQNSLVGARRRLGEIESRQASQPATASTSERPQNDLAQSVVVNLKQIVGLSPTQTEAELVDTVTKLTKSSNNSNSGNDGSSSKKQLENYELLSLQLRSFLALRSESEIIPSVRALLNKVAQYDRIFPQYDHVVHQLMEMLHAPSIDGIVPAVTRLLNTSASSTSAAAPANVNVNPYSLRPTHIPLQTHSPSTTSSVHGVRGSGETSPAMSAISDANSAISSEMRVGGGENTNSRNGGSTILGAAATPQPASAIPSSSSRGVTFQPSSDRDDGESDDPLSTYAPISSSDLDDNSTQHDDSRTHSPTSARRAQREANHAAAHADVEREIDEAISRTLAEARQQ